MGWLLVQVAKVCCFWGNDIKNNTDECIKVIDETIFDIQLGDTDIELQKYEIGAFMDGKELTNEEALQNFLLDIGCLDELLPWTGKFNIKN